VTSISPWAEDQHHTYIRNTKPKQTSQQYSAEHSDPPSNSINTARSQPSALWTQLWIQDQHLAEPFDLPWAIEHAWLASKWRCGEGLGGWWGNRSGCWSYLARNWSLISKLVGQITCHIPIRSSMIRMPMVVALEKCLVWWDTVEVGSPYPAAITTLHDRGFIPLICPLMWVKSGRRGWYSLYYSMVLCLLLMGEYTCQLLLVLTHSEYMFVSCSHLILTRWQLNCSEAVLENNVLEAVWPSIQLYTDWVILWSSIQVLCGAC